jgi:phosphoglycolate phosphatase-like HAD superfamily hydrolase
VSRVIALDFDGVVSDSAPEAFVIALRTYVALRPESALQPALSGVDGERAPRVADVGAHPLYPPFLERMPLGNRAEDYGVALASIEADRPLPDQAAYDAWRDSLDAAWLRSYHERFYRERAVLCRSDESGWHALMSPYPEVVDVLRRRAPGHALCIATSKDRGSVRRLLRAYGIDELFDEGRVLDKEAGVTKTAHLAHLRDLFDCRYAEMTFVDDKVNHLDAVARLGVRCALAAWGFNGPREHASARAAGHLVCTLDDFEAQVFG